MNLINLLKKNSFFIILLVLIIVSTIFWWNNFGKFEIADDAYQYHNIAVSLTNGEGYNLDGESTMMREPGYSFFMSVIYKIFGVNPGVVRVIQVLLLYFSVLITYYLSKRIFNELVAKIVTVLIAIYPILNIYTSFIYSETLALFLVMLFLFTYYKAVTLNKYYLYALLGIILGILILSKGAFILMAGLVPLLILFKDIKTDWQGNLKKSVLFFLMFCIVVVPWLSRNYNNFDRFALASRDGNMVYTRAVKNLYDKSEVKKYVLSAMSGEYLVRKFIDSEYVFEKSYINKNALDEFVLSRTGDKDNYNYDLIDIEMKKEGINIIKENPFKYFMFGLVEVINLNSPMYYYERQISIFHESDLDSNTLFKVLVITLMRIDWLLFILFMIYGSYSVIKEKKDLAYILILFVLSVNMIVFFL